MKADKTKKQQK